MRLRVGLVGLGDVWHVRHAPALRAMADRFEIRAVCDQVGQRAEQAAEEFHADAVDGYRALACREDIDAVMVLSPQWYGALPILAACEAGKAVYCAAGLDLGAEETQLVKCRAEETGIAFVAEFPRRQAPATIRLKELIATRLGQPHLLFCHQRSVVEATSTRGGAAASAPGDALSAGTSRLVPVRGQHGSNLCDRDCPPCRRRFGRGGLPDDDAGFLPAREVRQRPDCAVCSCGRYIPSGWQEAISFRPLAALQVSCARGIAFVDLPTTLVWFDEAGRHQESLDSERPVGEQLLMHFYRSVTSLVRKPCDLEDAFKAVSIVQACRRSHEEGRRIELWYQ